MRSIIRDTFAVTLAVLLAGCGGGGAENGTAGDGDGGGSAVAASVGDPCRFITADEMAAITTDAVTGTEAGDDDCTYKTRHDDNLRVVIKPTNGRKEMETARRAAGVLDGIGGVVADKGAAGADAATMMKKQADTPNVGDDAIWGMVGILYARKGDAYVEVYPPTIHDPATHKGMPLIGTEEKRKITTTVADRIFAKIGG